MNVHVFKKAQFWPLKRPAVLIFYRRAVHNHSKREGLEIFNMNRKKSHHLIPFLELFTILSDSQPFSKNGHVKQQMYLLKDTCF